MDYVCSWKYLGLPATILSTAVLDKLCSIRKMNLKVPKISIIRKTVIKVEK